MHHPLRHTLILAMSAALLLSSACSEPIEVDNYLAVISQIEAPELISEELLSFDYALSDAEGDDQALVVEICEGTMSAPTRCGVAFEGSGSDGVTFVPTDPDGATLRHVFVWEPGCGRVDANGFIATELTTSYVARIAVRSAQEQTRAYGEPFSLEMLGLSALPTCSR